MTNKQLSDIYWANDLGVALPNGMEQAVDTCLHMIVFWDILGIRICIFFCTYS